MDEIKARREGMDAMIDMAVASFNPLSAELEEFWIDIPTPSGWKSRTKIVRPKTPSSSSPLIVLFFGGGFMLGNPSMMTRPAREFAETFGACVACPTYRLLPEVDFPVPAQDGYDVVRYLSRNAEKELGVDLAAGFIVGGVSAGATISSVIAGISTNAHSRDNGTQIPNLAKPLTGVYLSVPLLLTADIVPDEYKPLWTSRDENKDIPPLTANEVDTVMSFVGSFSKSHWLSPVYPLSWSSDPYPPTYIQVGGRDILRDDGVIFEKIISSHGTKTKIDVFPKDPHASWVAGSQESESKNPTIEEGTMRGMKWLLQK
jgi:acetyl esterase/lipase